MAKPTKLPVWATGDGALIVEPNLAKKEAGWARGEKPPAEYENWRAKLVYNWLQYIDGGALEGDHSVDGDLDVTGDVRHGDKTLIIEASAMQPDSDDWVFTTGSIEPSWSHGTAGSDGLVASISLHAGDRIKGLSAWCKLGTGASDAIQMRLYKVTNSTGSSSNQSDLVATANETTRQEVTFTGITPEVITVGTRWVVVFVSNANVLKSVYSIEVTYDRPPPP